MHISGWCPSSSARFASEFTKTIASLKLLNLNDRNKCPSLKDHKGISLMRISISGFAREGVPPSHGKHFFSIKVIFSLSCHSATWGNSPTMAQLPLCPGSMLLHIQSCVRQFFHASFILKQTGKAFVFKT